jgi:hypothetical protein
VSLGSLEVSGADRGLRSNEVLDREPGCRRTRRELVSGSGVGRVRLLPGVDGVIEA